MGVSGSGKTTTGKRIAKRLGVKFTEGDDYHPEANVAKMRGGTPLTDEDRWPWLDSLARALHEMADTKRYAVAACSALKKTYRDFLIEKAGEPIYFLYLDVSRTELERRVGNRKHDYMPASLLDSQLATLEPLQAGETGETVGVMHANEEASRLSPAAGALPAIFSMSGGQTLELAQSGRLRRNRRQRHQA
jgi:carbohydrate kinase (thermoresistant glucokinase family)